MKRWRLARQGLSSGKKRRVRNDHSVSASVDHSPWIRFTLYLGFCTAAGVLIMQGVVVGQPQGPTALHAGLAAFFLSLSAVTVVELNHPQVVKRNGRVVLLFGGILTQLFLVHGVERLVHLTTLSLEFGLLLSPFVLAPMVHAVLLGPRAGVFSAVYVSVLTTLLVPDDSKALFLTVSLLCGLVAALALRQTRRRSQLLRAGLYSGLMAVLLAIVFGVIELRSLLDGVGVGDWQWVVLSSGTALGVGIGTALVVGGILPVLEGIFRLTTGISWLELSDLNHKLLRRMQLEAPGTFHHSLVVASLAESAAEAIGANAAMCRVCSYFHDIGKLTKPEYFIENQHDSADNPHHALTPTMSALIIIAHVKDGVDLALKHHLNPRVIDVIREHHGDSLVTYFYRKAREQKRSERDKIQKKLENPEDLPKVDQKNFRYPGPCPRSRESGIISLADAVESASRTLTKPTPAKIRALVGDLVQQRICDGQLDDSELTMQDLATVRDVFCKTLRSMLHSRIAYPKEPDRSRKSDLSRGAESAVGRAEVRTEGESASSSMTPSARTTS